MSEVNLPDVVTLEEPTPGYPVYVIRHPKFSGKIARHGAHVMEWTPSGQRTALYLSPTAIFKEGKAIRGGIPLCWPWFGPHATDTSLPSHGFVRTRFWNLIQATATESTVTFVFEIESDESTKKLWPFQFVLRATIIMGESLTVRLETFNTDKQAIEISEALHAYFSIGEIVHVNVTGLDQTTYMDVVDEPILCLQEGPVMIDQEVDRNYISTSDVELHDLTDNRCLLIKKRGSGTTVIWNPWIEKAATLADLPDKDYQRFLCIEPANEGNTLVIIPPGENHCIEMTVTVQAT